MTPPPSTRDADDAVWINLKIVASLPAGCRLNTQRELFYHQPSHWWTGLTRMLQGARRAECVRRVGALVSRAVAVRARGNAAAAMDAHLAAAADGIRRLKTTYAHDATTRASLDRVLDKIAAAVPPTDAFDVSDVSDASE